MLSPRIITVLSIGLLTASPAFAAAVTQDGARDLQARFTQELASHKDIKAAGMKSQYTGDVSVMAKGTYYEVTMPTLKLTDTKNNTLNVGRVMMNMMPSENTDEWKSSVSLPSTMNYTDVKGKNSGTITLGSQKASGIWDMKLFGLKKLDSSYSNVAFKNSQTKESYSASDLTVSSDMVKSDEGTSGPVNVTASNLSLVDAVGRKSVLAPSIKVKTQVEANKNAPKGYTQTSQAEVTGLTNALNVIGEKLKDPNTTGRAQLQKTLGVLSILQMSGKPSGDDTRNFNVVTNAQGQTLLNGVDVSLLLGAASVK